MSFNVTGEAQNELGKEKHPRTPHTRAYAWGTCSLSPACMLCHRTQADTDICGHKRMNFKLCVHTYCQVISLGAPSTFLPSRALRTPPAPQHTHRPATRSSLMNSCVICYKMGASITCCHTGCDRTFHLPCAPDGGCVTQYFGVGFPLLPAHKPSPTSPLPA
uniref:PHD-type domain-containing protein n=1 Tax=Cyanistes caeruleus TaxID=156563 RepID=A0A8C0V7H2_CYACU